MFPQHEMLTMWEGHGIREKGTRTSQLIPTQARWRGEGRTWLMFLVKGVWLTARCLLAGRSEDHQLQGALGHEGIWAKEA